MTTNADGGWPDIVLDPRAFHASRARLQLQCFLIKFSRAFFVRNGNGDKCYFLDHSQISFLVLGFEVYLGFGFGDLELAAATAFCAASAKSSAAMTAMPDCAINFCPASTFVPSNRTTSGTDSFTAFAALMIPCATTSTFMIPPKMLTRIAFTFLSPIRILNASVTCSSVAPPPTSRKF